MAVSIYSVDLTQFAPEKAPAMKKRPGVRSSGVGIRTYNFQLRYWVMQYVNELTDSAQSYAMNLTPAYGKIRNSVAE